MLISQPFMNRFGSYLDQNGGEKGSYMPRMNLEGYGVGVINYGGIYYDAGKFRMTSYGNFSTMLLCQWALRPRSVRTKSGVYIT